MASTSTEQKTTSPSVPPAPADNKEAVERLKKQNFPVLQNDLILRAARGERTERVPVWLHRQAGRYLPEFRETRKEYSFFDLCQTPPAACAVTIQPIDRFPLDAAIIFSDILVVPQALGLECLMLPGKGPSFPQPLTHPDELKRVKTAAEIDVYKELGYVFQAITLTRHTLKGRVPVIGFSGAPWTLMAYMVAGGGAKSYDQARSWFYRWPAAAEDLLERLTSVIIRYLVGQVLAGAQMLEVFDSWAGDLSPDLYNKFVLPSTLRIASEVKKTLKDLGVEPVPMTLFPKGAHFALEALSQSDYNVISLDWSLRPEQVREQVQGRVGLQGNLDPAVLFAPEETIRQAAREMIDKFGTQRYIANLGHGMLPDHEPGAVAILVDEIHKYSEAKNKASSSL